MGSWRIGKLECFNIRKNYRRIKFRKWIDSTASDQGYIQLGVSFIEWYEKWLDDLLEENDGLWWL